MPKPLLLLMSVFFLISSVLLTIGLAKFFKGRNTSIQSVQQEKAEIDNNQSSASDSLNDYFDKAFKGEQKEAKGTDEFSRGDPFLETCSSTKGNTAPSVTSNTVCLR